MEREGLPAGTGFFVGYGHRTRIKESWSCFQSSFVTVCRALIFCCPIFHLLIFHFTTSLFLDVDKCLVCWPFLLISAPLSFRECHKKSSPGSGTWTLTGQEHRLPVGALSSKVPIALPARGGLTLALQNK